MQSKSFVLTAGLTAVCLTLAATNGLAGGASERSSGADAGPFTLQFTVWNYSVETIQDNIDRFQELHPDVEVELSEYVWTDYHDTMVLRLRGGTPTHVIYGGEDWLAEWASAGWLAPIEEHFPEIRSRYASQIATYALQDMTYDGQLYGLPYYADLFTFLYNEDLLAEHDIAVPGSWDELLQASLQLKQAGIDKPFTYVVNQELPNFYAQFVSMVYGRGGRMFDDELNPLFNDPESAAWQQLQWLRDANLKHGIMAVETDDTRTVLSMNTGKHAFTVTWNYLLAAMNERANQPLAGSFAMGLMPGDAKKALGFAKFYAMTTQCADDARCRDAAWRFIQFMGGDDFRVAKRWAVEKGLGFAQLPLYDDPDVTQAWSTWIDMETFKEQAKLAEHGTQTEWMGIWSAFWRPFLAKAMLGNISIAEAMQAGDDKWMELRGLMGR